MSFHGYSSVGHDLNMKNIYQKSLNTHQTTKLFNQITHLDRLWLFSISKTLKDSVVPIQLGMNTPKNQRSRYNDDEEGGYG